MTARILVIEDNPTNLELMIYLLSAHGYQPATANDGLEGLAAAEMEQPDLIVCDVHLPKADGFEVVRRLRAQSNFRDVPVIAVTALAMVGDRERLLNGGFDGYIAKPIQPEKFVKQVEAFLPTGLKAMERKPEAWTEASAETSHPARFSGTVLVIDDTGANRDLLRSILEPHGYRVITSATIAEAQRELRSKRIDLIITDVHLRDGTSLDFIAALRADREFQSVPVLVQSASAAEFERSAISRMEGIKLLPRPLPVEHLLAEVQSLLPVDGKGAGLRCP